MSLLETPGGLVLVRSGVWPQDGKEAPALVFPQDTPRTIVASHALSQPATELTGVERIVAVYRTARFVLDGVLEAPVPIGSSSLDRLPHELMETYGAMLQRRVSEAFALRLVAVLSCPLEELELMHRLELTIDHVIGLLDTSAAERRAILRLHGLVPITVAETKKLTQTLLLLRGRKAFDLAVWLDDVTRDRAVYPNGGALNRSLRRIVYPTLTSKEDEIAALRGRLKLPAGMKVTCPENLEGDSFSCYFDFSRIADLERQIDVLKTAIQNGSIARMLDILNNTEKD